MRISVVQPSYYAGQNPDVKTAEFLLNKLNRTRGSSLILLPEYANAGGLSDPDAILAAMPRAGQMLTEASRVAYAKQMFVALNVLEQRGGLFRNSTYLFKKDGQIGFIYDKLHLPPSEISLGIRRGSGECTCVIDGIRFAFMTCYDIYFSEQLEKIARFQPDIILIPGYQRGERTDIIRAQAKLAAFRCNAYVLRASFSMGSKDFGGCSMIVSPDGRILKDMGHKVGILHADIDETYKYMRPAGFGEGFARNDEFITNGCITES